VSNPFVDPRGWPVVDRLLVAAFRELVTLPDADVWWGTAFPDEVPYPAGRVIRLPGGGINPEGYEDLHRIEVLTLGRTRPESDALTAGVRQTLADLDGEDWSGVGIDRIREESGPGRVPDPNEDLRAVPTTWGVLVRRQPRLL
jgi:hypothetical protein